MKKYDESKKTSYLKTLINDLNSQTGFTFSVNKTNQLVYALDSEGNPVVSTTTDSSGNQIQVGSAEARKIMTNAVSTTNQLFVITNDVGRTSATSVGGSVINLVPSQINEFVSGAVGVNNKTLGWGMTFMHEVLHSNVADGGPHGHGAEAKTFGPTGVVVDRMNVVRSELNQQGGNYGQRSSYSATYIDSEAMTPKFIPFDRASKSSIQNGNEPNTMFIQIK